MMFATKRLIHWFAIGFLLTALNLPLLYLLVEFGRFSPGAAMLLAGEIGLLARFIVNDLWIFRNATPILRRLWQFHVASGLSFVLWWTAANVLNRMGVHYLIAAAAAISVSVGCNLATNFLWIWREKSPQPAHGR